ncbi:uncharacterized protein BJ171DRAFT_540741 [Polychytrium aggregatum]|uniref:uncharacterized protein n=1 Tax=Polychytrium aggregatum TaxID=110093 RepID=UPI0022FE7A46|nr:uncharacterized protein BJ171DRAFT_540741 [Polychytrium aggregatum]KAI9190785.1 hypothetical protein BJ171DRAFT_540741 [Polychytrium aggregatum]
MIDIKAICSLPNEKLVKRLPMSRLPGELTFDELCVILHRLFRPHLSASSENLVLKYADEDGDLVCLETDTDITHALTLSTILKVHVFDKVALPYPGRAGLSRLLGDADSVEAAKATLLSMKGEIEHLLQVLQVAEKEPRPVQDKATTTPPIGRLSKSELSEFLPASSAAIKDTGNQQALVDGSIPSQTPQPQYPLTQAQTQAHLQHKPQQYQQPQYQPQQQHQLQHQQQQYPTAYAAASAATSAYGAGGYSPQSYPQSVPAGQPSNQATGSQPGYGYPNAAPAVSAQYQQGYAPARPPVATYGNAGSLTPTQGYVQASAPDQPAAYSKPAPPVPPLPQAPQNQHVPQGPAGIYGNQQAPPVPPAPYQTGQTQRY